MVLKLELPRGDDGFIGLFGPEGQEVRIMREHLPESRCHALPLRCPQTGAVFGSAMRARPPKAHRHHERTRVWVALAIPRSWRAERSCRLARKERAAS